MITDTPNAGDMHHFTNLVEVKWITNQFTNIVSPPRLLTSNRVVTADHLQPESISIPGNSIYISGSHRVNSAMPQNNYGLLLNYPLPLTNNTMPTNWMTIWGDDSLTSGNQSDIIVFQDVVATTQGVFMVAVTNKDYFPVLPTGRGFTNEHRLDVDTGFTDGTFHFNLNTYTVPDHFHVYYEGVVQSPPSEDWPGIGNSPGVTYNVPFSGNDSFVRLVINQGGNTHPGTAWDLNSVTYTATTPSPVKNKSIVVGFHPSGPIAGGAGEDGAIALSRAITNNPYGVAGDDRLFGMATQFETGFEGLGDESSTDVTNVFSGTNYIYVTGSAQFDLAKTDEKFFLSKVTHDGLALWTATEQVGAGATVQHSGGAITGFDVYCPGTNYAAAPAVTIVDLHSQATVQATATAAIHPTEGHVTGITVTSGGTGYQRPVAYIEKPGLSGTFGSAGLDVDVLGGTNIFAVGYSNTTAAGTTSKPMIWAYDDQGCLLWVKEATAFDGEFTAVQVSRTNIYAVGRHRLGSGQSSAMIQEI